MEPTRYQLVREIFTAALDLPAADRVAFVAERCDGDESLRKEVESLFSELETSQGVALDRGPGARLREAVDGASGADDEPAAAPTELPESVGDYRVRRCLGEGGMGVVYEAEQQQPRRRVAVKVLRPGYATPSLVKRFRLEAELLGRLQHPGIARVYEAGEGRPWGGSGPEQPFLVMEYVEGAPLTAWAARRKLTLRQRLELLAKVCDGVQHAHERGVVHRDLKPANVLVDPAGQPRILDFGVARALDSDIAMGTAHTGTSQLVGTLPYMSPEQLGGHADELGPLSDVYALGVLAYELLAGRLPLQLAGLPLGEAIDRVQDVDPPSLGGLNERCLGDVEAIVSKALEKEPARRYGSAAEMAGDIRRHLADEPIQARPQSAVYKAAKFVRRNRKFVLAVASSFVVLLAGVSASSYLAIRELHARRDAEQSRDSALRSSYRAHVGAALTALEDGRSEAAAAHVERAPEELRDWTWAVARARLDDSIALLALSQNHSLRLLSVGDDRFVVHGDESLLLFRLDGGRPVVETELPGRFVAVERSGRLALEDLDGSYRVHRLSPGSPRPGAAGSGALLADGSWLIEQRSAVHRIGSDGRELARLDGLLGRVRFRDGCGPDGSWLFLRRDDGAVLVDPSTGRTRLALGGDVTAVTPAQDGRRVLVAGSGSLSRVDPGRPDLERELLVAEFPGRIKRLSRAPRGPLLAIVEDSLEVTVWDVVTGRRVATAGVIDYGVPAPLWSPDGERLLVPDRTGVVRQIEARTGRSLRPWLVGQTDTVAAIAWSEDASRVVTLADDGMLRIFRAPARGESTRLRGHEGYVYGVDFAQDGRELVSVAWDGSLRTWDAWAGTQASVRSMSNRMGMALDLHPDGSHAVVAQKGGLVSLNLLDGTWGRATDFGGVNDVAVSPSGHQVFLGMSRGGLLAQDWETGEESYSLPCASAKARASVAVAPDGSSVFVACGSDLMRARAADGEVEWRIEDAADALLSVAVSPDGSTVAASGRTGLVVAWDAATGDLLWRARSPGAAVHAVAFHPSGSPLVTGSRDGVVRSWRIGEDEPLAELRCHDDYVYDLAFSADGDLLASASADTTICLWDRKSRAERAALIRGE